MRRDGRSHAHPLAVLVACRRPDQPALPTRCGFTAGRRVGSAVRRNRARRLLREAVRARQADLAPGWDLVFIARPALAQSRLAEVAPVVEQLLRRARVLKDSVSDVEHDG